MKFYENVGIPLAFSVKMEIVSRLKIPQNPENLDSPAAKSTIPDGNFHGNHGKS